MPAWCCWRPWFPPTSKANRRRPWGDLLYLFRKEGSHWHLEVMKWSISKVTVPRNCRIQATTTPPQAPWLNLVPAWWDLYHPVFLGWARLPLPQKQLTTWKVFAGQIGCNSDVCYLRSMLEFHKRSCTQHVFNHPATIYLLQVPLGWKHPKIPTYPIAFFSYGQSKTMHIEYNLLQSIFISICISVYLCCLYFYIYL